MSNPFQQHGAFSWFELMTSDQAAAKQFYSELFDWSLQDDPVEGMNYTVVKVGDLVGRGYHAAFRTAGDHQSSSLLGCIHRS